MLNSISNISTNHLTRFCINFRKFICIALIQVLFSVWACKTRSSSTPHKKMSGGIRSGDCDGHSVAPHYSIHLSSMEKKKWVGALLLPHTVLHFIYIYKKFMVLDMYSISTEFKGWLKNIEFPKFIKVYDFKKKIEKLYFFHFKHLFGNKMAKAYLR